MSGRAPLALSKAVRRFRMMPVDSIHSERLAEALGMTLRPETRDRLLAAARLAPRLSALVHRRLPAAPIDTHGFAEREPRLALLDAPALAEAALLAGSVWHGRALKAVILAQPRTALLEQLGEAAYAFGIANADLSVAAEGDERTAPDALMAAVEHHGRLCLGVWLAAQPAAIVARVRLKLPSAPEFDAKPDALHREHAPGIMARVARELVGDAT